MAWPPNVERWRPLVERHFPPELVDKALHVINYESGGDPDLRGDGGVAIGLYQVHSNESIADRPTAEWLLVPENNIAFAAEQLGAARGDWRAWGEGNLYKGKPFGALGHHPYPGTGAVPTPKPDQPTALLTTYTVQIGDTLSTIGARLKLDWREIARINGIVDPFPCFPGQVLRLSIAAPEESATAATPATYTVLAGDTLSGIGAALRIEWQAIAQANGLTEPFVCFPGQVLVIPQPTPAPATKGVTKNSARG